MQLPKSSCTQDDVLICANAISAQDLAWLKAEIAQSDMKESLVSRTDEATDSPDVQWLVDKAIRDTQELSISPAATAKLDSILKNSVDRHVNAFFGIQVRDWEPMQLLHYGVGGHYIAHVDAETLFKDEIGLEMWEKTLDRDLSIVYFLNDDFDGGELYFPVLDLLIKPQSGTLVCFPSDHHFVHGVKPVMLGHRYTAVTWLRVTGVPSVDEINQEWLAEYERAWPEQVAQPSYISLLRRTKTKTTMGSTGTQRTPLPRPASRSKD